MRLAILILLGLFCLSPVEAKPPAMEITSAEASAVSGAAARGRLIYAYDQAAWHGTDDLQAKMPDYAAKVGGWIVDGPGDAPQLVFFDKDQADPHIVYVADFSGTTLKSSRVLGAADDRTLSPRRKAMIAARRAAIEALAAAKKGMCKGPSYNTVVLPPAAEGQPILVYVMTPQTDLKAVPMGGHYRIEVTADGQAGTPRPFTNSCLEMPFEDPKGSRPEALFITHLLDPTPTEIHVFSSLSTGLPIMVATTQNNRVWAVMGDRIRLLGPIPR